MMKQHDNAVDFANLKVGDILVSCWGATMLLYDFFQVVGKTAATVKIRELAKNNTPTDRFLQYDVTPIPNRFTSDVLTRRLNKHGYFKGTYQSQLIHASDKYDASKVYTEDHAD